MDNSGFSLPAKGFVRRETSKLNFEIILYAGFSVEPVTRNTCHGCHR